MYTFALLCNLVLKTCYCLKDILKIIGWHDIISLYSSFSTKDKDRLCLNELSESVLNTTRTFFEVHNTIKHPQFNSIANTQSVAYTVAELLKSIYPNTDICEIFHMINCFEVVCPNICPNVSFP